MAKSQINTKSSSYQRDKEAFLKELKQFNDSKGIPYKVPKVNAIEIDLYHFYTLVQQKGGLHKVNQSDTWDSFLRPLRLPHPCINGSTLLKRIYSMYLEKYERAKGPPGRDDDNDIDEDPRRTRGGGMPRITFSGGTYISASGETLRTGGPTRVAGPSERLALSLLSPMPNEQDFAVNVCTVLAADHSNRLPLSTTPHILDFLLAHAGVYNHLSLRDTIGRSYYEARGRYPDEFWRMRAGGGGAKELADETKFMQPGLEQPELCVQALAAHHTLTDCLDMTDENEAVIEKVQEEVAMTYAEPLEDWVTEPSEESQMFASALPGGAACVYTQRVLQVASIVRSLSFHDENLHHLAKNTTLIRFLLLCANSWVGTLRQSGLDTLGNIATELIIKEPATCLISRHVISTIQASLVSADRARVLAALELLNKLAQNEANEDALLKNLEAKVSHYNNCLMTRQQYRHVISTIQASLVSADRARVLAALELLNKLAQNEANEDALLKNLEAKVSHYNNCLMTRQQYRHVISTIQASLVSADRARVLAALELLNKLAQNEANEDALLKNLEAKVSHYNNCLMTRQQYRHVISTIQASLVSADRARVLAALELLNKLAQNEANEDALLKNLEAKVSHYNNCLMTRQQYRHVISTIQASLVSADRARVLAALELLNKLAQNEANEDALLKNLEAKVSHYNNCLMTRQQYRHVISTIQASLVSADRARVLAALELLNKLAQNEANEDALLKNLEAKVSHYNNCLMTRQQYRHVISTIQASLVSADRARVLAALELLNKLAQNEANEDALLKNLEAKVSHYNNCLMTRQQYRHVISTIQASLVSADRARVLAALELLNKLAQNEANEDALLKNLEAKVSHYNNCLMTRQQYRHVISTIQASLVSADRARVLAALELLNKLAQNEANEDALLKNLEAKVSHYNNCLMTRQQYRHVISTIQASLVSADRARVLAALELLNKLAQNEANEDALLKNLEAKVSHYNNCLMTRQQYRHVISTIQASLVSADRARVLAALELLNKLAQNEANEDALLKNLEAKVSHYNNCLMTRQQYRHVISTIQASLVSADRARVLAALELLNKLAQNEANEDALLKNLEAKASLVSADRARVLAALELLNKLAQNEANEDALLKNLEAKVYTDVCALLTLRDIMVLVCTLECVYALTSLGDRASEAVARVPGLVHTLVSLLTVEAQSYGPRACILMRVVETVSGPSAIAAAAAEREQREQQQQNTQQAQQPPPQQSQPAAKPAPEPATSTSGAAAPAATTVAPMSSIQQSHLQQRTVQENEHFAQAWLRSTYEALPAHDNSACDSAELYRQYLACCTKLGRKGVIAPLHFPRLVRLVRTVFGGTVGPNTVTISTGETQQVYIGIRAKNQPRQAQPGGPASPILQAQLTSKTAENKPVVSQTQPVQQQSHPHLSQALEPAGAGAGAVQSNTSLIKHLLAHKVSPATQMQVAQRQQNQQQQRTTTNVVLQSAQGQAAMEVDPEALIKCTTITPGGVASTTPIQEKIIINAPEEMLVPKEETVQIQIDEQAQLTIKTAQNKMLADLLEKKSNPPVQVVQMTPQINAPTIQITETGQIVHVKPDLAPVIQISDPGVIQGSQYFTIKNEQGQIIQIKNEQGQIIQLKGDQIQPPLLSFKNDQGQIVQVKTDNQMVPGQMVQQSVIQGVVKTEKDQLVDTVVTDHSYVEPPSKKLKLEDKRESNKSPQESVSKTAANLYAALAASALEDEEDLVRYFLLTI
ncbi:hypothetical protein O0L34_g9275 [Tuta absoluta]|nr:hypothetical protein O0L34_g9275 [Tuta absoluta]